MRAEQPNTGNLGTNPGQKSGALPCNSARLGLLVLFRLAAYLHGLPLRLGDGASAPERGGEIATLNHAIELRSWMAAPDAEQSVLRDAALESLRTCGRGQPVLIAAARGMLDWLTGQGSRP